jgi:hypothetical protein
LRYLGTPVAAREMARRLTDDDDWASDFMFGLVGSPARDTGLREMKMLLIDPHFPASSRFLRTMAVMTLDPNATGDLLAQREEAEARFRQQLKSALKGKKGQAGERKHRRISGSLVPFSDLTARPSIAHNLHTVTRMGRSRLPQTIPGGKQKT